MWSVTFQITTDRNHSIKVVFKQEGKGRRPKDGVVCERIQFRFKHVRNGKEYADNIMFVIKC